MVIICPTHGRAASKESRRKGRLVLAGHGWSRNRAMSSPDRRMNSCGVEKVQGYSRKESPRINSGSSLELKAAEEN